MHHDAKASYTPILAEVSNKFGFVCHFIRIHYKDYESICSDGFRELKKSQKQPENRIFGVLAKIPTIQIYTFLLQYEISNGLLTFCKNNMFWKNVLLELWSKNLKTNQIAGFFKLQ